jgi:hypothetical protein
MAVNLLIGFNSHLPSTEHLRPCGKIGFLPNRQMHIRARVSGANFCARHKKLTSSLSSLKLILKVNTKESFCVKTSHGSFHDILPREYSGTLPELLRTIKGDAN